MRFSLSDLVTTPLQHGVGILGASLISAHAQARLGQAAGLAATVAAGYFATQQGPVVRRIGQGVLASVAAGVAAPFIGRLFPAPTTGGGA